MARKRRRIVREEVIVSPIIPDSRPGRTILAEKHMIEISYIARSKVDNSVVDTNIEDVAKAARIYREDRVYGPSLIVIGGGEVVPAMDKALIGMRRGEVKKFEADFKDAYGPSDTANVKLENRKEFQRLEIKPRVGLRLFIKGKEGKVLQVNSDKVRIDYNHHLAGVSLDYEMKVEAIKRSRLEKIMAILEYYLYPADLSDLDLTIGTSIVTIRLPVSVRYSESIQFDKTDIARKIYENDPRVKLVSFVENLVKDELGTLPNNPNLREGTIGTGEEAIVEGDTSMDPL